jgi:hypothetical protein
MSSYVFDFSYKVGVEEVDCKGHFDEKRHLICLIGDGKSPGATTKFGNQGAIAIARDRKGGRCHENENSAN